jgi:hypothetical protein
MPTQILNTLCARKLDLTDTVATNVPAGPLHQFGVNHAVPGTCLLVVPSVRRQAWCKD